MLRNELELVSRDPKAAERTHLWIQGMSAADVFDKFRKQLLAFAHHEWPFVDPVLDGNTLGWWESVALHPHACVLGVRSNSLLVQILLIIYHVDAGYEDLLNPGQFNA